jgi:RNA polymerase sigma-70 factor (ECF subfamily)
MGALLLALMSLGGNRGKDDASLVTAIKKGNEGAFRHIFDRYHPALYRFLVRFGVGEDAAQDILQDVFSGLWSGRARLDPARSIRAYLYRSCRNRAANHFRKESRLVHDNEQALLDGSRGPDEETDWSLIKTRLDEAVRLLPERRRAVFELCFIGGLSYKEAGIALDIAPKTVENHMGYALKAIRAHLAPFMEEA